MKTNHINCLNCRHASLLPHTDFNSAVPVIRCARMGDVRVACLTSCPLADRRSPRDGGDRCAHWTAVGVAWLRAAYPVAPWPEMMAKSGRTRDGLKFEAKRQGLRRAHPNRTWRYAFIHRSNLFNAEQQRFMVEMVSKGLWPMAGKFGTENREREAALRQAIVDGIAARGQAHPWRSMVGWKYNYLKAQRKAREQKDAFAGP